MINGIKNCKKAKYIKGITLIALVVTIVVLLILASVSITVVFGDNGILQLAKEAGEKTNEAIKSDLQDIQDITTDINTLMNNWDTSKVSAVTSADGKTVPVPKGFVASEIEGENTIKDGFVIYEITEGNNLNWQADENKDGILDVQQNCNQFVWVPADGVSLEYKQDKETWSSIQSEYTNYNDWWDEEIIEKRKASVAKYGGFYVGRYEAGLPESNKYNDNTPYETSNRNTNEGNPIVRKGYAVWNYVSQTNAKKLSENMYENSSYVTSRLIDSYAWDTICTWLSNNSIDVMNSTSWGNYLDASFRIKGLYSYHAFYIEDGISHWNVATYSRTTEKEPIKQLEEGRTATDIKKNPRKCYEVATGVTVVDENGNEIDRNKVKNIFDFAGNMWEWTTEIGDHSVIEANSQTQLKGEYAVLRGGCFTWPGDSDVAAKRWGSSKGVDHYDIAIGFRPVLYISL